MTTARRAGPQPRGRPPRSSVRSRPSRSVRPPSRAPRPPRAGATRRPLPSPDDPQDTKTVLLRLAVAGLDQVACRVLDHEFRIASSIAAQDRQGTGHVLHDRVGTSLAVPTLVRHQHADIRLPDRRRDLEPRVDECDDTTPREVIGLGNQPVPIGAGTDKDEPPAVPDRTH